MTYPICGLDSRSWRKLGKGIGPSDQVCRLCPYCMSYGL